MAVCVLGKQKTPLQPCTEKRARLLLERGRAVVICTHPFTIRLKDRIGEDTQPSQTTEGSSVCGSLHTLCQPVSYTKKQRDPAGKTDE